MNHKNSFSRTLKYSIKLFAAGFLIIIQGCGGSSSPVTDADPAAYYEGGANVKTSDNLGDLVITDLKGIVNGSHFMLMSQSNNLVYDGTITDITGNNFIASVNIYVTGQAPIKADIEGVITEGSQLTGTLKGTGPGNGSFTLTYNESSNDIADLTKLDCHITCGWSGKVNDSTAVMSFQVFSTGEIRTSFGATDGFFKTCKIDGSFSVIPNTNFYSADMTLSQCTGAEDVDGNYTGLVTTLNQSNEDQPMVMILTNETYGFMGIFNQGFD